jgi:flagellar basal-body rod protein FlgG
MTRGIYTAATGMLAEENAQQIIAQNLANASTVGYKQEIPAFKTFEETLVSMVSDTGLDNTAIGTLGQGATLDKTYTDLSEGPLEHTGNALDIALRGDAYISVQTPAGVAYSRDGELSINGQGLLVQNTTGLPVLDNGGKTISMPQSGTPSIESDGDIRVNGQTIASLGLFAIDQDDDPTKLGDNLISVAAPPKAIDPQSDPTGFLQAGYLETSNVNIVKEMVTMIACQRSYEANAKALQSQDEMQDRAASQVGAVQG